MCVPGGKLVDLWPCGQSSEYVLAVPHAGAPCHVVNSTNAERQIIPSHYKSL